METANCFSESESFEPDEQPKEEEKDDVAKMAQSLLEQKDTIHLLSHGKQLELYEELFTLMAGHKEKICDQLRKPLRSMLKYLCYLTSGKMPNGKSVFARRDSARRKGKHSKKGDKNSQRGSPKVTEVQQANEGVEATPNVKQNGSSNSLLEIAKRLHVDVAKIILLGQIFGSVKPSGAVALVNACAKSSNEKEPSSENQLSISANQFDANGMAEQSTTPIESPIHNLSGGTLKYLDDDGYNLMLKKSLLVPAVHCGILMGRKGSTLRMIELITNSILTFGHWNDAELWCFVTIVTDNKRQQDSALALLHFLLKYRISLTYDDIMEICRQDNLDSNSTTEANVKRDTRNDLANDKKENVTTSQPEHQEDTVAQTDNDEEHESSNTSPEGPIINDNKLDLDASNHNEEVITRSETVSESETDDDDEHTFDEESPGDEHAAFRLRIPQENECSSEEAVTVTNDMVKLLVNGNGKIGKVIQHFSGTCFRFDGTSGRDDKTPKTLVIKAIDEKRIQCAKEFIDLLTRYDVRIEKACEPTIEDQCTIVGTETEKNIAPSTRKHLLPTNLAWLVPVRNFKIERCSPARMLKICEDGLSMDFGIPLELQIELRQADSYMDDWNFLTSETIRQLCERGSIDSNGQTDIDSEQAASASDANTRGSKALAKSCCPRANQSDEDKKKNLSKFFQAIEASTVKKPLLGKKKEICELLDIMRYSS